MILRCGDRELLIGARTYVMGIVNVTPDSFSDGFVDVDTAVAHAVALVSAGADIIDVGGESTAPGRGEVAADVERARVVPVIERLVQRGIRCISVDTRHGSTALAALHAGASWVNDVSALQHDDSSDAASMIDVVTRADAVVLMHARPFTTSPVADDVDYGGDVVGAVRAFLVERVAYAVAHGVQPAKVIVDPGIGFGKNVDDNVRLLSSGRALHDVGAAVLVGPSRKRFLGALAGVDVASDRDAATHGAIAAAIWGGAHIVRVHDVKGAIECARVIDAVMRQR